MGVDLRSQILTAVRNVISNRRLSCPGPAFLPPGIIFERCRSRLVRYARLAKQARSLLRPRGRDNPNEFQRLLTCIRQQVYCAAASVDRGFRSNSASCAIDCGDTLSSDFALAIRTGSAKRPCTSKSFISGICSRPYRGGGASPQVRGAPYRAR